MKPRTREKIRYRADTLSAARRKPLPTENQPKAGVATLPQPLFKPSLAIKKAAQTGRPFLTLYRPKFQAARAA
ncbi:hypothetical protein AtDm6_3445 [Acetobacter tropicalis]|uniref:Uncharacterized protein n=1 Tax=Acetobacter tropicalis TaxID=104102 RepID=A0A094YHP7_9PROT|nr:hypothetical protein AtDm6_3445 [Acetobacter tropicalis]